MCTFFPIYFSLFLFLSSSRPPPTGHPLVFPQWLPPACHVTFGAFCLTFSVASDSCVLLSRLKQLRVRGCTLFIPSSFFPQSLACFFVHHRGSETIVTFIHQTWNVQCTMHILQRDKISLGGQDPLLTQDLYYL